HMSAAIIGLTASSMFASSQANAQANAAPAQAQQPAPDDSGLGEIIVTAQKREQRLNDVGVSVAVASSTQLQSAGVI
ncbi:hypothetical protein ABTP72_19820, partial [Acinetobacter baumannii]